ncbi:helix-turn-helix transcriptional regulator [Bacteroides sp.]|uniref:helix-turn-helix domain-containing protein n=1 Tax=Bacteroides sp. TaxID=29523 RepID=UPI001B4EB47A|nr:helix-turn-helix transcriptional regulator [Bacteroides sp.]MBP6064770.1 helix-turn-helix transcriptional regulator [Bacteroides sp.]MBP6066762.1 helix-turn-helix transcriptional regulator [Bacteroides sp.]MBP6936367.1 helix-turn-helix transcriptional regulator [Bacteroides sp.]MBP8621734.1 helix-turn-helix transcriptional regulator [Bacteroides sp.]MBP9586643.1 helix-turn-helix transcriptional regulator [Bacteroides sp.]
MDIKDRIKMIMERENMTSGAFAESISIQQSTLSHILNGRNNPSLDVIMKVHQRYNYILLEWLLYGKGSMMQNDITGVDFQSSLFDENPINPSNESGGAENRKEMALRSAENSIKDSVKQEVRYIEKPHRRITEIRIFFDDNTYETFKGEK